MRIKQLNAMSTYYLCTAMQVLHIEIQGGLEDTFPGSWNRNHLLDPDANLVSKEPSNLHDFGPHSSDGTVNSLK